MRNLFLSLRGQSHRLTPTFIIEPEKAQHSLDFFDTLKSAGSGRFFRIQNSVKVYRTMLPFPSPVMISVSPVAVFVLSIMG